MAVLHIDLETYSSLDLKTVGVYRYVEAVDFEILLFAYAFDEAPIQIIDLASGEKLPEEVLDALTDPRVEKHAHNAAFERNALRAAGFDIPVEQWHCSAVKAAYCGYPFALEQLSDILNLGEHAKHATGKALIRYFCVPCKPSKTNGMRSRNLPGHDPIKWQSFKAYCMGDVAAEIAVSKKLSLYQVPGSELEYYALDQHINDRGIKIDRGFVNGALSINETYTNYLMKELKALTGLSNPNSAAQLKKWLSLEAKEDITTLNKKVLPDLLKTATAQAREVLTLRSKSSKTSIKKYAAMLNCVCEDGRARGLFQFYGAFRTGRWAGRLIQLQNLPQNHLNDLDLARQTVDSGDFDLAALLYDDIASVLSQLVRTAFIASPGHVFAVADYSAIEARVLAWVAGEQWRLDVFNTHGKIYEASASAMFGEPIENITKSSPLRQKGKIAELALGYQGGVGALKTMGADKMGLTDDEMALIVTRWRESNKAVVKLWQRIEAAAISAVATGRPQVLVLNKYLAFSREGTALTLRLPSGRKLYYQDPTLVTNKWGRKSLRYKGLNQETKTWGTLDTYGGKLVENLVQAISRDLLADAMARISEEGPPIAMHVHDEIVAEAPADKAEEELKKIRGLMAQAPSWAQGLPLNADGYTTHYYKKD